MSHHEVRLEQDLQRIKERVHQVGREVQAAVQNAVHSLLSCDQELAAQTILGDLHINRETREIDRLCHAFVARHYPSAGPLRFVSSVLRLDVGLERIGDYAVTIAREAVQLKSPPPKGIARDIEMMADHSRRMLQQGLQSFHEGNPEMARGAIGLANQIGRTFTKVFNDLIQEGEQGNLRIQDLFALLVSFNRLERISDQAKNICEETVFAATGQTKEPKVYRILFLDRENNGRSKMAEAFARKAFPESGKYRSAGWQPAGEVPDALQQFLDAKGCTPDSLSPVPWTPLHDELADQHVVVGLESGAREQIPDLPFHTVFLDWSNPPLTEFSESEMAEAFAQLANQVRELMETMHGEDAG
ncbi:MAG: phosphate transport system regulatory protein PhoU [Planctomycetota bacterium]|nr:MAG: phosphate transport system regulatory protein PhoU [Planctomycetota bacterium]